MSSRSDETARALDAFRTRLRAERNRRGWSIRDLAARAGAHYRTVAQLERGGASPTLDTALRLAAALSVPLESLLRSQESD